MVNTFIALSARNGSGLLLVAMDRIIAVTADGSGSKLIVDDQGNERVVVHALETPAEIARYLVVAGPAM